MAESIVKEIQAKSILVPSKLPAADYVINPYTGCAFGCSYCYASFMGRFVGRTVEDWGNYVFAKVNLPEVLDKELRRTKDKTKSVFLSSVTDPYQGVEQKYQLTRQALKLLLKHHWQGTVGILTKSPLVTRDIDLFKQFPRVEVGLTVTSTDDAVSRFLERAAPPASLRLKALQELNKAGIKTYAFVGPLLPHFAATPQKLNELFAALKEAGVKEVFVEHINLSPYIRKRLLTKLKGVEAKIIKKFYQAQTDIYRHELDQIVMELLPQHQLVLRLNEVIYHHN